LTGAYAFDAAAGWRCVSASLYPERCAPNKAHLRGQVVQSRPQPHVELLPHNGVTRNIPYDGIGAARRWQADLRAQPPGAFVAALLLGWSVGSMVGACAIACYAGGAIDAAGQP
jgi:hypothetical protein